MLCANANGMANGPVEMAFDEVQMACASHLKNLKSHLPCHLHLHKAFHFSISSSIFKKSSKISLSGSNLELPKPRVIDGKK